MEIIKDNENFIATDRTEELKQEYESTNEEEIKVEPHPEKPLREYHKNQYLIPQEIPLELTSDQKFRKAIGARVVPHSAFRTSDKEVYIRNAETGVIRSMSKEVKGKANKKKAKRAKKRLIGAKQNGS